MCAENSFLKDGAKPELLTWWPGNVLSKTVERAYPRHPKGSSLSFLKLFSVRVWSPGWTRGDIVWCRWATQALYRR